MSDCGVLKSDVVLLLGVDDVIPLRVEVGVRRPLVMAAPVPAFLALGRVC